MPVHALIFSRLLSDSAAADWIRMGGGGSNGAGGARVTSHLLILPRLVKRKDTRDFARTPIIIRAKVPKLSIPKDHISEGGSLLHTFHPYSAPS